jgi:hypothetical protein
MFPDRTFDRGINIELPEITLLLLIVTLKKASFEFPIARCCLTFRSPVHQHSLLIVVLERASMESKEYPTIDPQTT